MGFALPPAAQRGGYRLQAFDTIGSTSTHAMDQAREGEVGPVWFASSHQTEGRGRRGHAWETPPGNLAATLLVSTGLPPATIAQLGFVAGLALVRALSHCAAGRASFSLKWPNDVLAGRAKLAGILLATEERAGIRAVTIGIGVNVASAPEGLPYPATSLDALGVDASAEELFYALADTWVDAEEAWDEGRGFDTIRKAWLAQAAGLGGEVAVTTGTGISRGRFETIDGQGQLILRGRDGSARPVSAGEVHFGAAATAPRQAVS